MTLEDIKKQIEQKTGVPASLLTGETAEEAISQAKALLSYRGQNSPEKVKSTEEKFADWFRASQGIEEQDEESAALAEIAEAARIAAGDYPSVRDGGEVDTSRFKDGRPAIEQFEDWFKEKDKFNPFKTRF